MSTFGVHYRTRSPGQLGLRVAGFPGHWVAGSQNVPSLLPSSDANNATSVKAPKAAILKPRPRPQSPRPRPRPRSPKRRPMPQTSRPQPQPHVAAALPVPDNAQQVNQHLRGSQILAATTATMANRLWPGSISAIDARERTREAAADVAVGEVFAGHELLDECRLADARAAEHEHLVHGGHVGSVRLASRAALHRRRCRRRRVDAGRRLVSLVLGRRLTVVLRTYDRRATIRYDTRCYVNVRSKADISQLNLPHGTDN